MSKQWILWGFFVAVFFTQLTDIAADKNISFKFDNRTTCQPANQGFKSRDIQASW